VESAIAPPPVGAWFRAIRVDAPLDATDRRLVALLPVWHRFAGDVDWRPAWRGPAFVAACGFQDWPARRGEDQHGGGAARSRLWPVPGGL
jgi:hypothetical protein